jgi:hypothetical protein
MALSIDDLLNSLKSVNKPDVKSLENNKDTWSRIAKKDNFTELGMTESDLNIFLKEWIENNPYSAIS